MKISVMPLVLLLALAIAPIATAQTYAPSVDPNQAKQLEYLEALERWKRGAAIPPANVSDVKEMWYTAREADRRKEAGEGAPAKPSKTIEKLTPEQFGATQFRWMLLGSLFGRGVLKDYTNREKQDVTELAFCAAATMPFTMKDWLETGLRLQLTPEREAQAKTTEDLHALAKTKEDLRALGYDPEKPIVDGKFLDYLRDNCR